MSFEKLSPERLEACLSRKGREVQFLFVNVDIIL
jgi:hypothetical protein